MKVSIHLHGEDTSMACRHLIEHLEDARVEGVESIERAHQAPEDEALGSEWLDAVELILKSSVLGVILGKIIDWYRSRPEPMEIEVEENGRRIKIKAENPEEAMKQAKELIQLLKQEMPAPSEEAAEELELKPLPHERDDSSH
ncbi:MAG: hypothetical protein AAFV95_14505 [Bacteroidota bacterium]